MQSENAISDIASRAFDELTVRRKKLLYAHDPVAWTEEYLGLQLWEKQKEILRSVRDNRNTAVAAGHGVGKSYVAGILIAWWVDTHPPEETFVATTAPSANQLSIIWDNVRRVHGLAKQRFDAGLVDHPLPGRILGDNEWKLEDGTTLGQGRKPPDADADTAFQGRHAPYLLAIGDEAVGINAGFIEALGNIATGPQNRLLLMANPTDPSSAMAKIWTKDLESWVRMHISVFDSPTITKEPGFDLTKALGMSDMSYVVEKRAEWGEDDPRYIARVLGQWAFDAGNTVYTEQDLTSAKNTIVVEYSEYAPEYGCDIARQGDDSTYVYARWRGEVWTSTEDGKPLEPTGKDGFKIRKVSGWSKAPLVGSNPDNLGSAERIYELARGAGVRVLKVDAAGIGGGVIDGLMELDQGSHVDVVEMFGQAPSKDKREHTNLRAEQFFAMKTSMLKGELDLDPEDEDLMDELRGVQYDYTVNNALKIESKEEIRRRGRKSPDRADAVWYAYCDVDHITGNPINKMQPGEVVLQDPYEMMEYDFGYGGPGVPL